MAKKVQRRLAAILAADVVGYSRLMEADEAGTLAALKSYREDLIEPEIDEHRGRIVKLMGDGLLAEFASALDAINCAVSIQRTMMHLNAEVEETKGLQFRMGINLGDVVVENDDLYGDGVNIAARLEGLAEPGGICISGDVHRQIEGKLDQDFEYLGEQSLKNIEKPVQVFALRQSRPYEPQEQQPGSRSERPSVAVLPFTNMSGDPEQEYFSDGITEDIITELSRFRSLFVIARNSSFAYKGQSVNVGKIGQELGVAYVVEGSIRKAGNRVRISAQLVEAESGNHLWAERYDRELEDIFAVQDEVVREIAAAVPGQLDAAAINRARRRPVENLSAYDYVLRGEWLLNQDYGSLEALALFEKAIETDPQCARAYTRLAAIHAYSVFAHGAPVDEAAEMARSLAERALEIDPTDSTIQVTVADACITMGEHDLARRHIERAIKLNPNDYAVINHAGFILIYLGDHEEGQRWLHRLSRHDPFSGDSAREFFFDLYYMTRRYEDAIAIFRGWRNPPPYMYMELAAAYAQLDRLDDACTAIAQHEQTRPDGFKPVRVAHAHARMCARPEDREHWLEGYRKAGLEV